MVATNVQTAVFEKKNYPGAGVFRNHMVGLKGKEIINALKKRVILEGRYKNILNSIEQTRLIRGKQNKIFSIKYDEKGRVTIKINGKLIIENSDNTRDAVIELFDYALKK